MNFEKASSFILMVLISFALRSDLYGNSTLGYFYVNFLFGDERKPESLIFDTGSDLTLIDCNLCIGCGKHGHTKYQIIYDEDKNNPNGYHFFKCERANCQFLQSYSEGSQYYGTFIKESIQFNLNSKKYDAIIGCVNAETGLFVTQYADGIVGASPANYNPVTINNVPPTIFDIAFYEKVINKLIFSVCLCKNGGELGIGENLQDRHLPHAVSKTIKCNYVDWERFYTVKINKIIIKDSYFDVELNGIFDTGSTLTLFPDFIYQKIADLFSRFCRSNSQNCGGYSMLEACYRLNNNIDKKALFRLFPDIILIFSGGIEFNWNPEQYLVQTGSDLFCLLFELGDSLVLGASFMTGFNFVFDKMNFEITFTPSICDPTSLHYKHYNIESNRYNQQLNKIINSMLIKDKESRHLHVDSWLQKWYQGFIILILVLCALGIAFLVKINKRGEYIELVDSVPN